MLNRFRNALYGVGATDDSSVRSESDLFDDRPLSPMMSRRRTGGSSLIHRTLTRSASFREELLAGVGKSRTSVSNDTNHNRGKQSNGLGQSKTTKQTSNIPPYTNGEIPDGYCLDASGRFLERSINGKPVKFQYSRPEFLQLRSADLVAVSADHQTRPVLSPRGLSSLPWKAGYAECINAGKSARNEDQAVVYSDEVVRQSSSSRLDKENQDSIPIYDKIPWTYFGMFDGHAGDAVAVAAASQLHNIIRDKLNQIADLLISLEFGTLVDDLDHSTYNDALSDAQASPLSSSAPSSEDSTTSNNNQQGSESSDATDSKTSTESEPSTEPTETQPINEMKTVLDETGDSNKVNSKEDYDNAQTNNTDNSSSTSTDKHTSTNDGLKRTQIIRCTSENEDQMPSLSDMLRNNVTVESLIKGVLESAFWEMDSLIAQDKQNYNMPGGCTALVSLFILGRLYVCNAGDSRAIVYKSRRVVPMSNDFTPISERERILRLGLQKQELLGSDFTHLEFVKRPTRKDLGKQILYKDAYMTGWSIKTATYDDLKIPLVLGEGKRSRVLATIGVTRGFGDHELRSQFGSVPIKPFLTPEPEVKVLRLDDNDSLESEDVLIMGTDGLWDVTSNESAASLLEYWLLPESEESRSKYRYMNAALELVLHARGRTNFWSKVWRINNDTLASFDDISVFVIPLQQYREEYNAWLSLRTKSIRSKDQDNV